MEGKEKKGKKIQKQQTSLMSRLEFNCFIIFLLTLSHMKQLKLTEKSLFEKVTQQLPKTYLSYISNSISCICLKRYYKSSVRLREIQKCTTSITKTQKQLMKVVEEDSGDRSL